MAYIYIYFPVLSYGSLYTISQIPARPQGKMIHYGDCVRLLQSCNWYRRVVIGRITDPSGSKLQGGKLGSDICHEMPATKFDVLSTPAVTTIVRDPS